jgi:hypothetical protein
MVIKEHIDFDLFAFLKLKDDIDKTKSLNQLKDKFYFI